MISMARTKTYYPFDIGMENLLGEEFDFDLFLEDLRKDPPLPIEFPLPRNPPELLRGKPVQLTSEQLDYNSCGILQNQPTSPSQQLLRGTLNDLDIDKFVEEQKNKNTKRKTNYDIKKWYAWCTEHNELRKLEDLPPQDLDRLLGHFFVTIRKADGSTYEPDTISSFQRSIDRHLVKDLHKRYSIIRDIEFAPSREKLKAARKWLKAQGKGNKPNATESLEPQDVQKLWDEGGIGGKSPEQLQQSIWWLISTHMGTRGCDEHHKFRLGDFTIKSSTDGVEFVEFSAERGTKTRSGETEKSTNADARAFKPKMWAIQENPERCPVALFKKFVSHRPSEMCKPDSPLYLAINHKRADDFSKWYKKQPLGINSITKMMKLMVQRTSITGRKTNHSARKTMVETLCHANIPDSTVMQLSGHKSVQSLNHYKKPSLEQQKSISHLLSSHTATEQSCAQPVIPSPFGSLAASSNSPSHGPFSQGNSSFSNSSFSNCSFVLNFGGGPSQQLSSHSQSVSTPGPSSDSARPARKRPLVIYDSSDED